MVDIWDMFVFIYASRVSFIKCNKAFATKE